MEYDPYPIIGRVPLLVVVSENNDVQIALVHSSVVHTILVIKLVNKN